MLMDKVMGALGRGITQKPKSLSLSLSLSQFSMKINKNGEDRFSHGLIPPFLVLRYVASYCIVKTLVVKKFGKFVLLKHWQKTLQHILVHDTSEHCKLLKFSVECLRIKY